MRMKTIRRIALLTACLMLLCACDRVPAISGILHWRDKKTQSVSALLYEMRETSSEVRVQDGTLFMTHKVSYPYFTGDSPLEQTLNADYAEQIELFKNPDPEEMESRYADWKQFGSGEGLPLYENVESTVTLNQGGYLSILNVLEDWEGGDDALRYEVCETYRLDPAEEVDSCRAFLTGDDETVSAVIDHYYEKAAETTAESWRAQTILAHTPYTLRSDGLCFYCNVGDAEPRLEVLIPYTDPLSPVIDCRKVIEREEGLTVEYTTEAPTTEPTTMTTTTTTLTTEPPETTQEVSETAAAPSSEAQTSLPAQSTTPEQTSQTTTQTTQPAQTTSAEVDILNDSIWSLLGF